MLPWHIPHRRLRDAERFTELGSVAFAGSPSDFGKHLAAETEKWGKVIRAANIKPE
jgi:tripartite-type tricarboxylate transporter receptor subunit TctC